MSSLFTSERIESLQRGEIFVFGSNIYGHHGGGAARIARMRFGAVMGQGVGLQGRSYAIPTMHGGPAEIKPYVDEFIAFAKTHKELTFLVTRIGCGIAGFQDFEIAPLFACAVYVPNIILPESFVHCMGALEMYKRIRVDSNPSDGYIQKSYTIPTKRYCQTLDLRNDPELIKTYKHLHAESNVWKEILDGIRRVGILEMEIYLLGTRLFMIVETPVDFDWTSAMDQLAVLPMQREWEALTARYQVASPSAGSAEKWKLMERIFHLYENR